MTLHEIIEEIKEMDRGIRFPEDSYEAGQKDAYWSVLDLLTKVESEQPVEGLEKAAKENYVRRFTGGKGINKEAMGPFEDFFCDDIEEYINGAKFGAKWQAEQGVSYEDEADYLTYSGKFDFYYTYVVSGELTNHIIAKKLGLNDGDKVIVQIRRKI